MDLKRILNKHNITEEFSNAKKMDKENRIFISENYVVKLYYPNKYKYYFNEIQIYKGLSEKSYLPKLYYYGEEENFKYIVISRLKGKSLFDSWNSLNHDEKKSAVLQIGNIIKDINNLATEYTNFKEELEQLFLSVITNLNFSDEFLSIIKGLYYSKSSSFSNIELSKLIHVDVHFYNFFIYEGKVYAYDFENTVMAPLDYQLVRWYKMWKYPHKFKYPKDSMTEEEIKSYEMIMPVLLKEYPEISNSHMFEDRVKIYVLIYLLQEAKRCNLSEEVTRKYIDENIKVKIK